MSKYDALWAYIQGRNEETLVLRILRIHFSLIPSKSDGNV